MARKLFGYFRKGDANDPATFVAGIAIALSEYEPEIVEYVCSPKTGLPRTNTFCPSIPEIHEACKKQVKFLESCEKLKSLGWKFNETKGKWENGQ